MRPRSTQGKSPLEWVWWILAVPIMITERLQQDGCGGVNVSNKLMWGHVIECCYRPINKHMLLQHKPIIVKWSEPPHVHQITLPIGFSLKCTCRKSWNFPSFSDALSPLTLPLSPGSWVIVHSEAEVTIRKIKSSLVLLLAYQTAKNFQTSPQPKPTNSDLHFIFLKTLRKSTLTPVFT